MILKCLRACSNFVIWLTLVQILRSYYITTEAHGRLMDPPARNSMWRFGFPTPVNYNDNELFCGGYAVQWEQNGGKCGLCGDPHHVEDPRPHEAGGLYAKGIISRRYTVGQDIDIEVELTANHLGRFEVVLCPNNNPRQFMIMDIDIEVELTANHLGRFEVALCPNNNPRHEATQGCLDRHLLQVAGTRDVAFHIPDDSAKKEVFRYRLRLPPYVTCSQCVLQWTYYTGNMWGTCPNGTEAVGCGRSETFKNCADISIVTNTGGAVPPLFVGGDNPFLLYYRDYSKSAPYNVFPLVVRDQVCVPTKTYRVIPGMNNWCQTNCLRYPPNCPESLCACPTTCDAVGELQGRQGADVYCLDQCLVYPSKCPANRCRCYA